MRRHYSVFFVYIATGVMFFTLFSLLTLVYSNIVEKNRLEMKFNSEKAFNSIYVAMTESMFRAERIMAEEGVYSIGLYTVTGELFRGIGDVARELPIEYLVQHHSKGDDSTLGIYIYDEKTSTIEYFRLSRLNVVLETGTLRLNNQGELIDPFPENIPEILYIKFDGTSYFRKQNQSRTLVILGALLLAGLFLLMVRVLKSNREYRNSFARHEQLVKLGSAARTLAHEIKNPLSAITIQSAILKKTISEENKEELEIIDHEVQRITNLTDKVSEFLKQPSGTPEKIELLKFLRELISITGNKVTVKNNNINSAVVLFDRDRLRSIFENLIKNATESTVSTDGRDPEVGIEVKIKKKLVYVSVIDHGDGIPLRVRDKLFDPFFTTKLNGSGIGLSISKQFLEAQSGALKIIKTGPGGTVFRITLPLAEDAGRSENEDSYSR